MTPPKNQSGARGVLRPRQALATLGLMAALFLPACAPRVEMPRVDDSDYIFPEISRGELSSREEKELHRAWNDILTGQVARAEQAVNKIMAVRPGFRAGQTIRAFAALRGHRMKEAEVMFDSVLRAEPNDAAALVGLASVRRKAGQLDEALPLYLRAARLRPRDGALARRANEVKLDVAEAAIARAGAFSAEGRKSEAIVMLRKVLDVAPELSPVRLELADLLVDSGQRTEALSVLGGAQDADRNIAIRIASMRLEDGDLDGAETALRRGLEDVAEDSEGAALLARIKERRAFLALPEPLRGIGDASRVTRAELAALVVVRVEALKSRTPASVAGVASDLSRTWARPQVLRAIELGLMDVYPNHTFQPSGAVRRGELAVVAARVLDLVGWGRSSGTPPADMSPSHLQYASVLRVLGAGVMQNRPSGVFEPWKIISGAEAKAVVDSLARLSTQR
ncbi:MAG: tetratricopeptide repeat protein [Vicinamibacteria bacterium]|nr:tetratricopeptide repeat protein [Vicinamibacteria bacterium]